ncbi:hypothetical protein ACT3UJ_00070 [Halomonas sp. 86]
MAAVRRPDVPPHSTPATLRGAYHALQESPQMAAHIVARGNAP